MYNEQNNARIDESFENAKLVKKLPDEQNKIQKKHLALLDDVKIFMNETETWRSTLGGLSKIVRGAWRRWRQKKCCRMNWKCSRLNC
jgi:hypothetical protein